MKIIIILSRNRLPGPLFACIEGTRVKRLLPIFFAIVGYGFLAVTASAFEKSAVTPAPPKFLLKEASGKTRAIDVVQNYRPDKIAYPFAKLDRRLNPTMVRAATIAEERAHAHSRKQCWHAVKEALVASGAVDSRPKTALAKQAADELVANYGFKRLAVRDPYQAPVGSVLVYGAHRAAGHVEIRTRDGFVSDFRSKKPSHRPLVGVYARL